MNANKNLIETLPNFLCDDKASIGPYILENLSKINKQYSKEKDFTRYKNEIQRCFHLLPVNNINKSCKFYLSGFIEGEGSINVSIKKTSYGAFKLMIDPEFSITQHISGLSNLYLALCVFQAGRIRYKSGSNATFIFSIDNRRTLEEKIVPFYQKYVNIYGSPSKKERLNTFKLILDSLSKKAHLNRNQMMYEILPLWDKMRMQTGQINQTFKDLKEAQDYVLKNSLHIKLPKNNS